MPWGWTWVDEAPWGFAPFHYGRWVYVGASWCWAPGTYVRRPVYAPALVAWIGGPHLSVGLTLGGGPAVGWVPLAPREVYVPTYRVSPGYVRNVNVTHVTNITNITTIINNPQQAVSDRDYNNRKFPNAVTVVPANTLTSRQPVAVAAATSRDAVGGSAMLPHSTTMSAPLARSRSIVFCAWAFGCEREVSTIRPQPPDAITATGRSDYANQVNNALCFPYLFRAALDVGAPQINEAMKKAAVLALADLARSDAAFGRDKLLPTLLDTRLLEAVSLRVAQAAGDDVLPPPAELLRRSELQTELRAQQHQQQFRRHVVRRLRLEDASNRCSERSTLPVVGPVALHRLNALRLDVGVVQRQCAVDGSQVLPELRRPGNNGRLDALALSQLVCRARPRLREPLEGRGRLLHDAAPGR